MVDVLAQQACADIRGPNRPTGHRVRREAGEVPSVRFVRPRRGALLEHQKVVKRLEQKPARGLVARVQSVHAWLRRRTTNNTMTPTATIAPATIAATV